MNRGRLVCRGSVLITSRRSSSYPGICSCECDALVESIDGGTFWLVEVHKSAGSEKMFELQPHWVEKSFKFSTDPTFIEKAYDVIVPIWTHAVTAVVLCSDAGQRIPCAPRRGLDLREKNLRQPSAIICLALGLRIPLRRANQFSGVLW